MRTPPRSTRLTLIALAISAGAVLSGCIAWQHSARQALAEQAASGANPLGLYASSLHTLIERYRALPAVLALDPELIAALQGPLSADLQRTLNEKLERINHAAGSSTLELLDRDGLAIAASNWRTATSYVGHNYAFRPYFKDTVSNGHGRFYAVGVTSGIPGYFLSQAVLDAQGSFIGAMVVKLESPQLEREWGQATDLVLVSDARGIVFLASRAQWRYRELRPLSAADHAELAATRQYDKQDRSALHYRQLHAFSEGSELVEVTNQGLPERYLWDSRALPDDHWTLHLLRRPANTAEEQRNAALAAVGAWLSAALGGLLLNQRWRLSRLRRRNREELEHLVQERTAQLRTAQEGLVQTAKLAALGQMSAALAHEINQPLTAQRMQLASLRLLLDHGRLDDARHALEGVEQMLTRMAALTGHLKVFARKSPAGLRERLDLGLVLDQALSMLHSRIQQQQVQVDLHCDRPVHVRGDAIRLEQVLINILSNALDAMADKSYRRLTCTLHPEGQQVTMSISDSGGGIAEQHLPCVFDPFFTTKPVGEGLGLGLAVSYGIVHDAGGRLICDNHADGARFTLILPADPEPA